MAEGVAEQAAHVLEMMHPMREPPQPASIAPFLATLVVGCGVALVMLVLLVRARRRRAALRDAALAALARTRELAPAERLAAQAALLRRLVRRLAGDGAAAKRGQAWLEDLDAVFQTRFFTQGKGVAYGNALYGAQLPDVEALDGELVRLLKTTQAAPRAPAGPILRSRDSRTAERRPAA